MPSNFQSHFFEIIARSTHLLLAFLFTLCLTYSFAEEILFLLVKPLSLGDRGDSSLIFTSVSEAFETEVLLAIYLSMVLIFPIILLQFWLFIEPGLYKKEKESLGMLFVCSPLLFALGVLLSYFYLLPVAWHFLLSYEQSSALSPLTLVFTPKVGEYMKTSLSLLMAGGLLSQYPLALAALIHLDLLDKNSITKYRKFFILFTFFLGAAFSPPDLFSQILLALPLLFFYEGILVYLIWKQRDQACRNGQIT